MVRSFRFVLRALLVLLWDVQQRHWPLRAPLMGPEQPENVRHEILDYLQEGAERADFRSLTERM